MWATADELRANSKLTAVQYRDPVLGLVFLAYAENRFEAIRAKVEAKASARNPVTIADYKAESVLYVPDESRLSYLVGPPEGEDIGGGTLSEEIDPSQVDIVLSPAMEDVR